MSMLDILYYERLMFLMNMIIGFDDRYFVLILGYDKFFFEDIKNRLIKLYFVGKFTLHI